jgi:hypothetical protein
MIDIPLGLSTPFYLIFFHKCYKINCSLLEKKRDLKYEKELDFRKAFSLLMPSYG